MQCEACGHANVDGARFCASCGAILPTKSTDADPLIGQIVGGRFRVTGVLGEGGMGVVYVGEQQMGSTVRKVAIKTLHTHLSKDPSIRARFHRECGTVAELEHPNTIKVYDFGETSDGTLYIAMEFVAGRPLADVIRDEGPLDAERTIRIMRQVCGALDEAHGKGIIHRDLKPENVILTSRGGETDVVKVLDFGIAARSESADAQKEQKLTQQGMVLGTPPYMSPEQFTGKALDVRSDVYSLGVMAYEMLTGRLPFDADTPWQWATQHMTAQPIPFDVSAPTRQIPPGLRQSVLRSLSKDRDQRQGTAREFFTELSDGGRVTVEAAPPTAAGHVRTGTAAMDQVPNFPSAPQGSPGMPHHHAPMHAGTPQGIAVAAPPTTSGRKSGGGKGLIIGLGSVGAILLVAMAVVAARSMKNNEDEGPPLGAATSPTSATQSSAAANTGNTTTIAPVETAAPTPETEPPATGAGAGTTTGSKANAGTKTATTQTGAGKTATATATTATATSTTSTATPPPSGNSAACDACTQAAARDDIQGALAAVKGCSDEAKKSACMAQIRRAAPPAARRAAMNGDCGRAKGIMAAAGIAAEVQAKMLANTSCK